MKRTLENQLIEILDAEVAVYEQLAALKADENRALIDFDTSELESCTRVQDLLTKKATEMESKRRNIVRLMAEEVGEKPDDQSLGEVLPWLSPESAERVENLGEDLKRLLTDIARAQDRNATLIEGATRYIHRLIQSLLSRTKQDPFAYGKSGTKAALKEAIPGLLDRRA